MNNLCRGDIIWMDRFNELIEICWIDLPNGKVSHWSDSMKPNANQIAKSDAWIIFKYGVKVGSTNPKRNRDE